MIVADTSVWVSVLRSRTSPEAPTLKTLLDVDEIALALPVRIQLMAGVAVKDRRALTRALEGLPVIRPSDGTWSVIERWTTKAATAGFRFGISDLLIAALADEIGALVWSLDEDFSRMAQLKMVRLYG